jgi:hypothetical protein
MERRISDPAIKRNIVIFRRHPALCAIHHAA